MKRALAALGIRVAPIYAALAHDRHPERWARAPRYSRRALARGERGRLAPRARAQGGDRWPGQVGARRPRRLPRLAEAEPKPKMRLAKLPPLWIREHAKKHAAAAANAARRSLVARTARRCSPSRPTGASASSTAACCSGALRLPRPRRPARARRAGARRPSRGRSGAASSSSGPAVALGVAHTALGFGLGGADDGERARAAAAAETPAAAARAPSSARTRATARAPSARRALNQADALARSTRGRRGRGLLRRGLAATRRDDGQQRARLARERGHVPRHLPAVSRRGASCAPRTVSGRARAAPRAAVARAARRRRARRIAAGAGVPYGDPRACPNIPTFLRSRRRRARFVVAVAAAAGRAGPTGTHGTGGKQGQCMRRASSGPDRTRARRARSRAGCAALSNTHTPGSGAAGGGL